MTHRTPARRGGAHRAPRRLLPTLVSVAAAYAVTAMVVLLVVTVVLPVVAQRDRLPALATATLSPGASPAVAALADRETVRPSRSLARTVIREKPAPVARRVVIEKITWALPLSGYRLTGRFGDQSWLWSSGMHTGLDFAAPSGTPIRSIAAGVVREAGYVGSYGYRTIVSLPDGGEVWYCHQSSISVTPGQQVAAGQTIGTVGATGNSTGSHLHLEIRPYGEKGDPVDPYAVLASHGVHA
jgi:murein DD-endopeptidase MepM/ murein hydrolase activator NlpD